MIEPRKLQINGMEALEETLDQYVGRLGKDHCAFKQLAELHDQMGAMKVQLTEAREHAQSFKEMLSQDEVKQQSRDKTLKENATKIKKLEQQIRGFNMLIKKYNKSGNKSNSETGEALAGPESDPGHSL